MAPWYPILGWGVFWIALIASIIIFIITRKFYPIAYIISIALYVFTIGFVIDVFNLSRNWILLLLLLSSLIMIGFGLYISKSSKGQVAQPRVPRK